MKLTTAQAKVLAYMEANGGTADAHELDAEFKGTIFTTVSTLVRKGVLIRTREFGCPVQYTLAD